MSRAPARIGIAPPHPGVFIREEILDELGLTVRAAAKAVGVRRATISDLINGNAALSGGNRAGDEKAFGVKMETLLEHAGMARRLRDAATGRRDRRRAVPGPPLPNRADGRNNEMRCVQVVKRD